MRFRQIHMDFHSSEHLPEVGTRFDPVDYVRTLKEAHVDSVTHFAKCHHGWSYHDTKVGERHPSLAFDLLRAQFDACKRAGIDVPIYISVQWDQRSARLHPEWRQINPDGTFSCAQGGHNLDATWYDLDLGTPYLDYVCRQIRETVELFPDCDGIFLDIVHPAPSCSAYTQEAMAREELDWTDPEHRRRHTNQVKERYYEETVAAVRSARPDMRVFHNQGHLPRGDRSIFKYYSHFEIESLPTGGWGYDHFPLAATYARSLGLAYLSHTGKFHTHWGEFGGYKASAALVYETGAMLAMGARCLIGDHLHPTAAIGHSTYRLVGEVYAQVELKEPWCVDAQAVVDVGLVSSLATRLPGTADREARHCLEDDGAVRLLLECHLLFDVIDREEMFERYRLVILPDCVLLDEALAAKLEAYVEGGGRLLLTGESGLRSDGQGFALDIGAEHLGPSLFEPDFALPDAQHRPEFVADPMLMYLRSQRVRPTHGRSLGQVFEPYFDRASQHFSGHLNTPNRPEPSPYACGVTDGRITYLAHPVFSIYRDKGAVAVKRYVERAILALVGDALSIGTNLPMAARVTLTRQKAMRRSIVHLLYATPALRGTFRGRPVEVIQDLVPLHDIEVMVRGHSDVTRVFLEPEGRPVLFTQTGDGVRFKVERVLGHQMVALKDG